MEVQLCKRIDFYYQNFPLNSKFKIKNLVNFKSLPRIFFNLVILITYKVNSPAMVVSTLEYF